MKNSNDIKNICKTIQRNSILFGRSRSDGRFDTWLDDDNSVIISTHIRDKATWNRNRSKIIKLFRNKGCEYVDDNSFVVYWCLL